MAKRTAAPSSTTTAARTIPLDVARRLAITAQRLAGPRPAPDVPGLYATVQALGCLQLDPTPVVARSHLLVLWSRIGAYDPATLDVLLWQELRLFEYWAHCASIVLTADYPLFLPQMQRAGQSDSGWGRKVREWLDANAAFRAYILDTLRTSGPLPAERIEDRAAVPWPSSGWTNGRNVSRMLDHLWFAGQVVVAGRTGGHRLWDLAERWFPPDTPRTPLPEPDRVAHAAQRALRALGVARPAHIRRHFLRGGYPGLEAVLARLVAEERIHPVEVAGLPGPWYIHSDDLPVLDALVDGVWAPRTTLLSPFDNLICDRDRTEELFGFRFRIEIYVPKPQRQYGYFVLPILHGDRLIGRIDAARDRNAGRLQVHALHMEPDAPPDAGPDVARALNDLAAWLGDRDVLYPAALPAPWRAALA